MPFLRSCVLRSNIGSMLNTTRTIDYTFQIQGFEGPLDVGYSGLAADRGHVTFVEVVERFILARAIAAECRRNEAADALRGVAAHLHGRLGDAGNLPAILLDVPEVATDEYLRVTGRVQVAVNEHAASPVRLDPEQLAQR